MRKPEMKFTAAPRRKIKRVKLEIPDPDDQVGYGRPPKPHQFQKGQSGNPSGRPKGALNKSRTQLERLKQKFLEAAERNVKINNGGQILNMAVIDYIIQCILDRAARGEAAFMKFAVKLGLEIEQERKAEHDTLLEEAIKYKTDYEIAAAECKAKGIRNMPEPVPHPDHIVIGMDGTVKILGPMTPEEKKEYDEIQILRQGWTEKLAAIDTEVREIIPKLGDKRYSREKRLSRLTKLAEDQDICRENLRITEREYLYGGDREPETEITVSFADLRRPRPQGGRKNSK